MTTTTTESRSVPITAQDRRALRHADSIVFRLYRGQATIEANRDGRSTASGFDEKHFIYCGGPNVADYSKNEGGYTEAEERRRYTGFVMTGSVKYGRAYMRTLIDRLSIGGTVSLHWVRGNSSPVLDDAGMVRDELYLNVTRKPRAGESESRAVDSYLVDVSVGRDNSARMVKIDWAA